MSSTHQRTVRFETQQYAALRKIAAQQNRSISELLRSIISGYFAQRDTVASSARRVAQVAEYTQAALDTIILQDHPEHRESILAETARRMERYHGSR